MISRMTISPKFDVYRWTKRNIERDWMMFQDRALMLGQRIHSYMIGYISSHKKRGQSPHSDGTVSLEKSIKLHILATAPAIVSWGIGHIPSLQAQSPYWYVLNYGKTISGRRFIPGGGKFVPGSFGAGFGHPPYAEKAGVGSDTFYYGVGNWGVTPKRPIRPINYIESTHFKLGSEFRKLLASLRRK